MRRLLHALCIVLCFVPARAAVADEKSATAKPADAKVATAQPAAAPEKKLDPKIIQRKLRARTDLNVEKLPLQEVVKQLSEFHEIPIRLDIAGLKKANVSPDAPVTVTIENYTLTAALKYILKDFGLYFGVLDGAVVISNAPPEPESTAATAATVAEKKPVAETKPAANLEKKLDPKIIQRKLRARTDIKVEKLPLQEVVKKLSEFHEVPIRLDKEALKKANVSPDAPVTVTIENYTLSAALKHILKDFGLFFAVADGAVVITNTPPEPDEPVAAAVPAAEVQARVMVEAVNVNDAQQMQFNQQYQAMLRAELHFARHVCQATPEQMRSLREELDKNLKEKLPKENKAGGAKKLMVQRQGFNVQGAGGDPTQLARDRLAKAVKTCLSAEQAARFQDEIEKRTLDRRRAAAHNLVARLDREMILSATQRDQITESLLSHWNDAWCSSLQMFIYNDQFFPNIPDAHVVKFLNDAQKKIWPTITKMQGAMFNGGFMGGMFGQEVLWDDDEADAPAKGLNE